MHHQFKVKKSERGKRLEAFLYEKMGDWSHKQIKQVIDGKRVFVNGKNVFISKWNLKPGDRVEFSSLKPGQTAIQTLSRYQYVSIVFEDDDLLVTNKPPFVDYDSFVNQVSAYIKRRHGRGYYPYLGQIHRLDKETSGLLIFTKKKMANVLADEFRERRVKKHYLAVVHGQVKKDQGVIRARLEKGKFTGGKKSRVVHGDSGKESYTEYQVEERYNEATLLRILLGTGRTHQIRVHMAEMGHPIIGDKMYGNSEIPASGAQTTPQPSTLNPRFPMIKRQALHAHRIEFRHPITRKKMSLKAPIPKDIEELIDALRGAV